MNGIVDISFEDFVNNCEVLIDQYEGLLTPFFNAPAIRCWKVMIYSLKIAEWQKDRIWEVLNGDFEHEELKRIIEERRNKKNERSYKINDKGIQN